ncbi:hypothetical protein, partial [Enterobacter intestinihominis]
LTCGFGTLPSKPEMGAPAPPSPLTPVGIYYHKKNKNKHPSPTKFSSPPSNFNYKQTPTHPLTTKKTNNKFYYKKKKNHHTKKKNY